MDNFISFQIHGGEHHDGLLEAVATLLSSLDSGSDTGLSSVNIFSNLLPGVGTLANIHPLLVHFPIALLSSFFIVNLIGTFVKKDTLQTVAGWLLYLGAFSAIFTVLAGFNAAESVEHGENVHEIMEHHEDIGVSILSLSLGLAAWRIKSAALYGWKNAVFLTLSALLFGLVIQGADLGGLMVYQYGVAVHQTPAEAILSNTNPNNAASSEPQLGEVPTATSDLNSTHHHHDHNHHHDHH